MKPIECGSCDYLHYIPRTMCGKEGVQLVCGKIKKEITWFENPFSDDFQPDWCPQILENKGELNVDLCIKRPFRRLFI